MSRTHGPNAQKRRHIKRQLAKRDGSACFYCSHRFAVLAEATIDHLIPHCVLPTWAQYNLVLACDPCNQAKADQLPQAFLRPTGFGPGLRTRPTFGQRVRTVLDRLAVRTGGRSGGRTPDGSVPTGGRTVAGQVAGHRTVPNRPAAVLRTVTGLILRTVLVTVAAGPSAPADLH